MGVYLYCVKEDYRHQSGIKDREFENDWLKLEQDGMVTIKGTHEKGYAWDGCSPKVKFKDICFLGIPDGVLNYDTGKSKTYYASLVHDIFYQFSEQLKPLVSRKEVDQEFYRILKRDGFSFAKVYYNFVRLLGWLFW